jgi:L,D-peptidoglycan transpeptidase YkuD (ErfK/YbiS/YcfS/YnhG family)
VKPLVVLALVAGLLLAPSPAPAAAPSAARATATRTVHLGGVAVTVYSGTTQVVTVNRSSGYRARVSLYQLAEGRWRRITTTSDGRIGYGGLVRGSQRRQGSGTTPLGTFSLRSTFGTHWRQSGQDLPHRKIRSGDFWVQDNQSDYYNRYRNQSERGFRWWLKNHPDSSERLTDYGKQYEYAIVTSFNESQVRHRGAGIFVHVNGKGATAGCASAPRWFLKSLFARLDPDQHPVVAVGR